MRNSDISWGIPSRFPLKKLNAWKVTNTEPNIRAPVRQNNKNSRKPFGSKPLIKKNNIIPYKVSPQADTIVLEQSILISGSLGWSK